MNVERESKITVAICTYNRAEQLQQLVGTLCKQQCKIPYEILIVDNNSSDDTLSVLQKLIKELSVPLRVVQEKRQGIVHARNRAIEESMKSSYLAFIDDDEMPGATWLQAAVDAMDREKAECVGGEIRIAHPLQTLPLWIGEELRGFLGEVKYSTEPFWIADFTTPLWTGNIAYRMSLFANGLRFDERYNRQGDGVGGGEDAAMFKTLMDQKASLRYRPDMVIEHFIETWKIKRSYFLKLHYLAGRRRGRWEAEEYPKTILGVPPFLVLQFIKQCGRACGIFLRRRPGFLRQLMNITYDFGMIESRFQRWKEKFLLAVPGIQGRKTE